MLHGAVALRLGLRLMLALMRRLARTDLAGLSAEDRGRLDADRAAVERVGRMIAALIADAEDSPAVEQEFRLAHLPDTAPSRN